MHRLVKLEKQVLKWLENIPHLPLITRKWLAENSWWIVVIGTFVAGSIALMNLFGFFGYLLTLGTIPQGFYASTTFVTLGIITTSISFVFSGLVTLLFGFAVTPLKARQKKGWVLIFAAWLVSFIGLLISAMLTLSPFSFIMSFIFSVIFTAVWGYFLFEIHSQFAHVETSKGSKERT